MPAFNAENTIIESIDSILKQIGPTDEVIIVDDASTDNTLSLVKMKNHPQIKLLRHENNLGISASRNTAIKASSGNYIAFLDADDLWPDHRQHLIRQSIMNNDPDVISGIITHFYCPSLKNNERHYRLPKPQQGILPSSVVIRKSCVDQIGFFNETIYTGEFIDYMSRLKTLALHWQYLDEPLLYRRIHNNNYTSSKPNNKQEYLSVIRNHLKRTHHNDQCK